MMKEVGVFLIGVMILFSLGFVAAADGDIACATDDECKLKSTSYCCGESEESYNRCFHEDQDPVEVECAGVGSCPGIVEAEACGCVDSVCVAINDEVVDASINGSAGNDSDSGTDSSDGDDVDTSTPPDINVVSDEIDEETEVEVEAMDISHGAEMRLLQLEWRIRRAVLHGEAVINVVNANGDDASELESIIEELKLLIEEVQGISTIRGDQDAVNSFVEVKKDAISLVKEFREKARELLDVSDRTSLRVEFESIDRTELQEIRVEIRGKRRMLNGLRVRSVLKHLGEDDSDLAEKVESGEVEADDAVEELRVKYRAESETRKGEIREKIRVEHVERRTVGGDRVIVAKRVRIEKKDGRVEFRSRELEKDGFSGSKTRLRVKASNSGSGNSNG